MFWQRGGTSHAPDTILLGTIWYDDSSRLRLFTIILEIYNVINIIHVSILNELYIFFAQIQIFFDFLAGRVGIWPGRWRLGHPRVIGSWLAAKVHAPNHKTKNSWNIHDWWFMFLKTEYYDWYISIIVKYIILCRYCVIYLL